ECNLARLRGLCELATCQVLHSYITNRARLVSICWLFHAPHTTIAEKSNLVFSSEESFSSSIWSRASNTSTRTANTATVITRLTRCHSIITLRVEMFVSANQCIHSIRFVQIVSLKSVVANAER